MLINDSSVQQKHKFIDPIAKHRADTQRWLVEEEAKKVLVEDGDVDPTDAEAQMGRPYFHTEFESKLIPYLPQNVFFMDHPTKDNIRAVMRVVDGKLETICAYDKGVMPERSIWKTRTSWIPNRQQTHFNRKDLPKHEITAAGVEWEGERPGWKKIVELWGEQKRGWRTPLVRLVQKGILSVAQVENLFGSADTIQWANATGKRNLPARY